MVHMVHKQLLLGGFEISQRSGEFVVRTSQAVTIKTFPKIIKIMYRLDGCCISGIR